METLLEILNDIDNGIDWANESALIDDRIIDSFAVISLVAELEDAFDIEIETAQMVPSNFNSVDAMMKMIKSLQEE